MIKNEEEAYGYWWSVLPSQLDTNKRWNLLCIGSDLSLLSIKMSKKYKQSNIISLKQNYENVESHYQLVNIMDINNNLICQSEINTHLFQTISLNKEPFYYQIISMDIINMMMENTRNLEYNINIYIFRLYFLTIFRSFELLLGSILNCGYITFIYFPSIEILFQSISIFNFLQYEMNETMKILKERYNSDNPIEDILRYALSSVGLNKVIVDILPSKCINICLSLL